MKYTFKYKLSFDGETWTDLSDYVNSANTSVKRVAISSAYKSSTNILSFSLESKPKDNEAVSLIMASILVAIIAKDNVYVQFYVNDVINFNGVLDPTGVSQKIARHAESISLTVYDYTYLLKKDMEGYFEYPADFTVDTDGYYVFKCDPTDTETDLLVTILKRAGFTTANIDFENSVPVMQADDSTAYRTVRHVADDEDSTRTYRDFIDTLLHDNCKVLTTGKDGKFQVKDIYTVLSGSEEIPNVASQYQTSSDKFGIKCSVRTEDGIELTWSTLSTINTLIYDANLGGTIMDDGSDFEGGFEMDGLSYYPETSDIEDVYQEFSSSWLDRAYYTATSRLQNEDVSLLSAKNLTTDFYAEDGIELDDGYPIAESLQAQYRYKNTSEDTQYFHRFAIYGDCLYRYAIKTYTYPSDAEDAEAYESEFIYTEEQASEYTIKMAKMKNYGALQYTWSQTVEIEEGAIWHINPSFTKIDSDVFITSIKETYPTRSIKAYAVTAQGFGDYLSTEIKKKAIATGSSTGTYGKDGVDGVDGTSVISEYAKNTSDAIPPDPDTVFQFDSSDMLFMGIPMGYPNWSTVAPLTSELGNAEYIWQRNSN